MTQSRQRSDSSSSSSSSFSEWKTTTDFCEWTLAVWKEPFVGILLLMAAPHHHHHNQPSTAREELKRECVLLLLLVLAMLQVRLLTQPTATKKSKSTFTRVSRSSKRRAPAPPPSSAHLGFSVIPLHTRPPQIYVCACRRGQCGQIEATAVKFMGPESGPAPPWLIAEDSKLLWASRPLKDDFNFRSSSKECVALFPGLHPICTWCPQPVFTVCVPAS